MQIPENVIKNLAASQEADINTSATLYEAGKAYVNTIISLGYAGFFGIWAFTKETLPESVATLVALLMGVSIILFVVFELYNILLVQWITVKIVKQNSAPAIPTTLEDLEIYAKDRRETAESTQKAVKRAALVQIGIWPFFFLPSVISGFGAGLLLMYNFVAGMTANLSYWPN